MPNIKSVIKDVRKSRERQKRNQSAKSAMKTYIKKSRVAIAAKAPESEEAVRNAISFIDRIEDKGIIHRNAAARRKSRLMKRLNRSFATDSPTKPQ